MYSVAVGMEKDGPVRLLTVPGTTFLLRDRPRPHKTRCTKRVLQLEDYGTTELW